MLIKFHNQRRNINRSFSFIRKRLCLFCIGFLLTVFCILQPAKDVAAKQSKGELHAFYPSNSVFSEKMQKYIDDVDSLSFAWCRIDSENPGVLNTEFAKNGNESFYYPKDYIQPVKYAKSKGKSIQLNIYMDGSDCTELLPYEDKREVMINAILESMQTDITQGEEIYYDGVVIDFEGLCNTDGNKKPILYSGKMISTYYIQFLTDLKKQLTSAGKKLYVAVNPGIYYDGYDYSEIYHVADRIILMAHDYESTERLRKDQVEQFTGYDALEPINSPAPILLVKQALNEMKREAGDSSDLSKVWLQITFDTAQWQYDVKDENGFERLDEGVLSREERLCPLYQSIKDRIDNKDGNGKNLSYGYNKELQSPFIQYYNTSDKSWNIILYEDSNSISAKINLAKSYGIGGISLWSLSNLPDFNDAKGIKYNLNGWAAIIDEMKLFHSNTSNNGKAVKFTDKVVEKAVRDKLDKKSGAITDKELKSIYRLRLPKGVKSLKDLKYLTNLEYLDASKLGIKDITSIGYLTNLRVLYLQRNQISNINVLKKLPYLEILSLNGNRISDLKPLARLTSVEKLYLKENFIKDITPLKGLKNLKELYLDGNQITDYSPVKKVYSKPDFESDIQITN